MVLLGKLFLRLRDPLRGRVDFAQPLWNDSLASAFWWLLASIVLDMASQIVAHQFGLMRAGLALVTLAWLLWPTPRLSGAVGSLYCGLALGNLTLVVGLDMLHVPSGLMAGAIVLWQVWCFGALVVLFLQHLRTPKTGHCTQT